MEQQTVSKAFSMEGAGIHTGIVGRVVVNPAEANTGRLFQRSGVSSPAHVQFVVDTTRCTTLGCDGTRISTVEHLLSALAGCGIDNCRIEVEGPEVPILDGSALPFVEAIRAAGIETQGVLARCVRVREPVTVTMGSSDLCVYPADHFSLEVVTEFDDWPEGAATLVVSGEDGVPNGYAETVAPARTFAFRHEVEMLIAAGLAKGGSLDNALIITPPSAFSTPLRVASEWCAHKMLDAIGDLALLNARLVMRIHARRPGHRVNTALARAILAHSPEMTE
jgi:UDP-3-O-[3-hydroxymyristoyl] N-acetylglucosamine deacetylase